MKFRFRPEDFDDGSGWPITKRVFEVMAERANEILDAHLAKCPKVYGRVSPHSEWFDENGPAATHQAILFDVEEIEKPKPCEHNNVSLDVDQHTYQFECRACKAKLRPRGWQTVEG